MKYHFTVHKEGKGYWAECIELEGCQTQGDSMAQLHTNMEEALNLYLDEPPHSKTLFGLPKRVAKGKSIVEVPVEPKIAFAFLLRYLRLKHKLTQREVAQRLGFKSIFGYQKLEASKTANPEFATIVKLKKVFPELSLDDVVGF